MGAVAWAIRQRPVSHPTALDGSPPITRTTFPTCRARYPERVRVSIASPLIQPSPNGRRVGIRIVTFEACSAYRGRDGHYWPPPAQIRTRPTKASGSYLGCLTSKRSSGQG
jgi:hypothetical protein